MKASTAADAASTTQLGNGSPTTRRTTSVVVVVTWVSRPAAGRSEATSLTLPASHRGHYPLTHRVGGGLGHVDDSGASSRTCDVDDAGREVEAALEGR